MRNKRSLLICMAIAALGVSPALYAADGPATQPASAPATEPATQPADKTATADERHKHLDERWRQFNDSLRNNQKTRYSDAPILRTFKPGSLVNFSIVGGALKIETTDLATAVPVRVAVDGSKAVWIISRPSTGMLANPAARIASQRPYFTLSRFDFDAKDEDSWQARILLSDQQLMLWSQNTYNNINLTQTPSAIKVRVSEYEQMGQAPKVIYSGQAANLLQLRDQEPAEFRLYVLPLLARFADASYLQPGAADIYSTFVEIPADQKVAHELDQLIPQLDADDPADRDAASDKLSQLGAPGVLAALRLSETGLSEEQRLRLQAFISGYRHRPITDPAAQRADKGFLIDCLESDDPAVRSAAKTDLESQLHQKVNFNPELTGDSAATAADAVRKQLLAPPPAPTTQPTTQPAAQA